MASKDAATYDEARRLIRKAMAEHKLVLFVGSGTSLDAGMPSWSSAVSQIAQKLQIQVNDADMLKIPQYYYNMHGKHEYTVLMRSIFKYGVPLHPGKVHKLIFRFDADTIITTNYDHLLEQAAEESGKILHVVAKDAELPYAKGKKIIKMHGDFEHENFVLKEDDYLNYIQNFKLINNYITSLAGTNLILFVGYSFSDPDVKQILTCLKNALGNDLQQAYMISVGPFEKVVDDYFKKFGINVIYAEDIAAARGKANLSKTMILEETLQWILEDNNHSLLEELYQQLGPYHYLDFPYVNDVKERLLNFRLETGEMVSAEDKIEDTNAAAVNDNNVSHDSTAAIQPEINGEDAAVPIPDLIGKRTQYWLSNPILGFGSHITSDIFELDWGSDPYASLFLQICYVADRRARYYSDAPIIRKQSWYRLIDDIYHKRSKNGTRRDIQLSQDEYYKITEILAVMEKVGYESISFEFYDCDYSQLKTADKPVRFQVQCNIPLHPVKWDDRMENAMDYFDYVALEENERNAENWVFRDNPDIVLKEAHICYFLGNYLKAYNLTKIAASQYYHRPNYAKYFIAKCDQYYLGRSLIHKLMLNSEEEHSIIKKEVDNIDLARIFAGMPDLSGESGGAGKGNQFLKDLYSFQLVYKTFKQTVDEAKQTSKEAKTDYIIHTGMPAYQTLRTMIAAFYLYQQRNHFLVDDYSEVQEIYRMAFLSLLLSVLAKDRKYKGDSINPNRLKTKNIHEVELKPFDLLLAVKFSSPEEINQILRERDTIPISQAGIQYLELLAKNLAKEPKEIQWRHRYFRTFMSVCCYAVLSESLAKQILETLIDRISQTNQWSRYNDITGLFINHLRQQTWFSKCEWISGVLCKLIDALVRNLNLNIFRGNGKWAAWQVSGLLDSILSALDSAGKKYDRVNVIKQIFDNGIDMTIKVNLVIHMYAYSSKTVKQTIKKGIYIWKPDKDVNGCLLYAAGVEAGAISHAMELDENCFNLLEEHKAEFNERISNGKHNSNDDFYVDLIYKLVHLTRLGILSQKNRLKEICQSYRMEAACWLLDFHDEESFSKFNPQWLSLCDSTFLKKLAADALLKKEINRQMKEAYGRGKLDEKLVGVYFKYFS